MTDTEIVIDRRFNGPPDSGNGGYACGRIAAFIDGPARVTLHAPPPLDAPLSIQHKDEGVRLMQGETLIGRAEPATISIEAPSAPSLAEAEAAAEQFSGFETHAFPGCFVCGPKRAAGDGLRIFAGPMGMGELYAAPWTPDADLADEDGRVKPEFIWAALDCPSYFALGKPGAVALLGRLTAEIHASPDAGEACTLAAWKVGQEGRKHFAATALYRNDGSLAALAEAVWIELKG